MFNFQLKKNRLLFCLLTSVFYIFSSCSIQKQISKSAERLVLRDSSLTSAHVGISIFESAANKYWFNYQGDHYFVPASNTKIPTCYAAMKYLGDSLVGLEYSIEDSFLLFKGTGDPTLLHPDFKNQRIISFLKNEKRSLVITEAKFNDSRWGSGWSIGDIK